MIEMINCLQYIPRDKAVSIGITVLIFTTSFYYQYLTCSCDGRTFRCNEFMAVPFFIVFFVMLLVDRTFRRTAKHAAILSGVVIKRIIRALLFGLLWVVAVLLHGNWYFCCKIDDENIKLPCKEGNLSAEEETKKREMINTSKITGYTLFLGITVAALLTSWSGWRKVFEKKCGFYSRKTLYYQVVLEEEEKILEELLRKAVHENLTKEIIYNINRKDWDGCLNAAQEMINEAKQQKPGATNKDIRWISEGSVTGGEQAQQRAEHQQAQNLELQSVREGIKDTTPLFSKPPGNSIN